MRYESNYMPITIENMMIIYMMCTHYQFHKHCARNQCFHCIYQNVWWVPCTTASIQNKNQHDRNKFICQQLLYYKNLFFIIYKKPKFYFKNQNLQIGEQEIHQIYNNHNLKTKTPLYHILIEKLYLYDTTGFQSK